MLLRVVATCCIESCWMKFETGQTLTSSNNFQQVASTPNSTRYGVQRSQHVGLNNVASCCPTMLRAFARAFTGIMAGNEHSLAKGE